MGDKTNGGVTMVQNQGLEERVTGGDRPEEGPSCSAEPSGLGSRKSPLE